MKVWKNNRTWRTRYDDFRVNGYMLEYAERVGKSSLYVIDVGCSNGEAILECKKCLFKYGVKIHIIGIDATKRPKILSKAKNNLDGFINSNVLDVKEYNEKADVVICLNTIRYIDGDIKSAVIKKCAEFLKPKGVLITGINKRHCKIFNLKRTKPKKVCLSRWSLRIFETMTGKIYDTQMITRDDVEKYAEVTNTEWENMNSLRKNLRLLWSLLWSM